MQGLVRTEVPSGHLLLAAIERDAARVGGVPSPSASKSIEKRGFAGARWAHDGNQLSWLRVP